MDCLADHSERSFQVTIGGLEGVGIDRQRGAEHDQRGTVSRTGDCLFEREPAHRLHRHLHGSDHLAQLVERAGHPVAGRSDAAAFVVADVMDHVVAAEILQPLGPGDHVGADHVVAHHLAAQISAGLHHALDRLLMGPGHHDHVGGAGLGHHFGLQIAAVHRLEISHDRHVGKRGSQRPHAVQALGEDQRRARLQPVDAGTQCQGRRLEGFVDVGEIERNLDDWLHDRRSLPILTTTYHPSTSERTSSAT